MLYYITIAQFVDSLFHNDLQGDFHRHIRCCFVHSHRTAGGMTYYAAYWVWLGLYQVLAMFFLYYKDYSCKRRSVLFGFCECFDKHHLHHYGNAQDPHPFACRGTALISLLNAFFVCPSLLPFCYSSMSFVEWERLFAMNFQVMLVERIESWPFPTRQIATSVFATRPNLEVHRQRCANR